MNSILDLPSELQWQIFSYLTPKDLCQVQSVCRQWRVLSADRSLWKTKIAVAHLSFPSLYRDKDAFWHSKAVDAMLAMGIEELSVTHVGGGPIYAIESDDQNLFTATYKIEIRNLQTGLIEHCLQGNQGSIGVLRLSANHIFSGFFNGTIQIWDRQKLQVLHTLKGHHLPITNLIIAGNQLFSSICTGEVKIWDIDSGELLYQIENLENKPANIWKVGEQILFIYGNQIIHYWDIKRQKFVKKIQAEAKIKAIAFAGEHLVCALDNQTLSIRQAATGSLLKTFLCPKPLGWLLAVVGNQIIASTKDHRQLQICDLYSGESLPTLDFQSGYIRRLATNGQKLIALMKPEGSLNKGRIIIWDLAKKKFFPSIEVGEDSFAMATTCDKILAGGYCLKMWNLKIGH